MWVSTKGGKPSACCLATQHSFDAPPKVIECAYQTPLRPITEYAIPAWNPHTIKGVATVESVQRRAEIHKCVLLINKLNWSSLQEQRTSTDLSLPFYKIQYNLVALPFPSELSLNTSCTRKSHSMKFNLLPSFVDAYKYLSFFFLILTDVFLCGTVSIYYCYDSILALVWVHSQNLSVITYCRASWPPSAKITSSYAIWKLTGLKIKDSKGRTNPGNNHLKALAWAR